VISLKMPVAEALTFVMSAGAVTPGADSDTTPTLLDKLESWLKPGADSTPEKTDATATSS